MSAPYEFTNSWFEPHKAVWKHLLDQYKPRRILEIGSYEGACTCFVLENLCAQNVTPEVFCVDTWAGGMEHAGTNMSAVELRFDTNTALASSGRATVTKLKHFSKEALTRLLAQGGAGTFDLIYIDGSHQAPDVLADSVLAFELAKVGGLLIWDDYLWSHEPLGQQDPLNMPKPAIDAFINTYQRKLAVITGLPLYQLYAVKVAN